MENELKAAFNSGLFQGSKLSKQTISNLQSKLTQSQEREKELKKWQKAAISVLDEVLMEKLIKMLVRLSSEE